MTNIRPNMQPTKHHFTSVNGSTRAQGPTGSPVPPSFSASLKGGRERGQEKSLESELTFKMHTSLKNSPVYQTYT